MRALYIGQCAEGTTSNLRAQILRKLLKGWGFDVCNTSKIIDKANRLDKSIAFRYNMGLLVGKLNRMITEALPSGGYDLIWIDKAVWIKEETTRHLRALAKNLVHFTPDCAFYENRSKHFERSIQHYDYLVSTKTFEEKFYPEEKLVMATQGYDPDLHKPYYAFEEKSRDVAFVGLYEAHRAKVISNLLENGIEVSLGGVGWKRFAKHPNVEYVGAHVMGEDYGRLISSSYCALGMVSKRFPEMHTTRTFEIPACGTVLVSERNNEIEQFFNEDEVLYYENGEQMSALISALLKDKKKLEAKSVNGYRRVLSSGSDYPTIIRTILAKVLRDD